MGAPDATAYIGQVPDTDFWSSKRAVCGTVTTDPLSPSIPWTSRESTPEASEI